MSSIKRIISTTSVSLLVFLASNHIKLNGIPSSKVNIITSPLIQNSSTDKSNEAPPKKNGTPEPIVALQDKPNIQSWGSYMSEVAVASTVVVGSAALFASGGGVIGAAYGLKYGAIGASALSGATITGIIGAGCGLKVAQNNFNLNEKSVYSQFAYHAGMATFLGATLGASTATIATATAISTVTGMDIATTVSIATAFGYFLPTLVQEVKVDRFTEKVTE